MDPHLPFLKAIAANPPDDLPRMVYADFLEETGEPVHVARAHFIRTQIVHESLDPRSREYRESKALERRLFEAFEYFWQFELPECLRREGRVSWRRGFPDGIRLSLAFSEAWEQVSPEWFDVHPIQGVHIDQLWGPGVNHWTRRFNWTKVTRLRLGSNSLLFTRDERESTQVFLNLMTCPDFTALKLLNLSGNSIDNARLVRFTSRFSAASFAASLEELDLSHCHNISDAGANTLATAHSLNRLKIVRLVGVSLSDASVAMLRRRFGDGLVI